MDIRTLQALAVALLTIGCVVAALLYANRENLSKWRGHRRSDKRRKQRRAREAAEN